MSVNLLEVAKSYLNDGFISQVSSMLGENQQNTQKAFDGALPSMLGGLIQKSSEPGGTSAILNLIGEVMTPNRESDVAIPPTDGILAQLSSLMSSSESSGGLLSTGARISQSIFGEIAGSVSNALATYSGIKESSASTLMNIAGPVLLSLLGRKVTEDNMGTSGLAGLLKSQTESVKSMLPSGLGTLLMGIPALNRLSGLFSQTVNQMPPIRKPQTQAFSSTPAYTNDEESASSGRRWLPWLLLALGAVALFLLLRACNREEKSVEGTAEAVIDRTSSAINVATDSAGATLDSATKSFEAATAKLGAFFKRKLPSGLELSIPELGVENKLIQFIEDKSKPIDKTTWFNFDRLLFDTGKSTLRPESQEQLTNIASILKEYPKVHIKLGGYTDNTGGAALNKKLSQERADSVMGELVKLGIDKSRLEAEGYGPEHPIAPNNTAEGRAENRRIAIRVTQK